jgi:hypothetical protein
MPGSHLVSTDAPDTAPITVPPLTMIGIREMGQVKLEKLQKVRLVEAVNACLACIDLFESREDNDVRSELKELKTAVYANASNWSVHTQDTRDYLDRPDTGWEAIHKLAAEQIATPSAATDAPPVLDDAPPVAANAPVTANAPHAPPVGENGTGESDKTRLARSTALWCLSPFTPVTQEAMDKMRKVCSVNLRGEVCTASNCGNKHPKVCLVADYSKGKIPKAICSLWHMLVPFAGNAGAGNSTGRRNGPNLPPPAARGTTAARPRSCRPSRIQNLSSSRPRQRSRS